MPKTSTDLDDNNSLLYDVVDLGLDEVKERAHAAFGGLFNLDSASTNGTYRLADEVYIYFSGVLFQLS